MPVSCAVEQEVRGGTMTNRINGGWMTAVKIADCRTANTATTQPSDVERGEDDGEFLVARAGVVGEPDGGRT